MAHVVSITKGNLRLELDGRTEITIVDEGEKRVIRMTRQQMCQLVNSFAPMETHRRQVEAMTAKLAQEKR
jgi:hypothetical protein